MEARGLPLKVPKEAKMKYRLCNLEFGVNNLEDIRLLVTTWTALLVDVFDDTPFDVRYHTSLVNDWDQVRVVIEDRVPGQEVLLNFVAPEDVVQRFLDSLEEKGLEFTRGDPIPKMMIKCWFPPTPADPENQG
jgi:hypothetical protein